MGRCPIETKAARQAGSLARNNVLRFLTAATAVWRISCPQPGHAAANGLTGKSDEEIREALGNKFPKHIYHSIVCIGALVAHKEPDHWAVDALGAPHVGDSKPARTSIKLTVASV